MAIKAVIFDVDGTLIDSNQAHVDAWLAALAKHNLHVAADRIATEIGKGGDKLIPSVFGQEIEEKQGDALREAHSDAFVEIAESTRLAPFAGVRELFAEIRRRGIGIALGTSSEKKGLAITQQSAGLDLEEMVDLTVTGDMASESKPAPHILTTALKKLKLSPAQCVMVGDTPFDAEASRDSGMACLGMLCGGMNDEQTLRGSGMRAVYADPADLLSHLDDALRIASPGTADLTQNTIDSLMRYALAVAQEGMDSGEVPIGCVLARGDGTIIARGHNELNKSGNKTAHAEMVTFARAAGMAPTEARDLILVSTLEPCVMCLGAAMEAAVDTILFALCAPADGGRIRVRPPVSPESQMPRIIGGVLASESKALFEEFLKRPRANPQQTKFVRQLLQLT